ncbi:hypothetical protein FRB97_009852 [Tulasnella sp. 331]|nr:hypothetical protein FRB97_009852 [Tulasnella sp. 331]
MAPAPKDQETTEDLVSLRAQLQRPKQDGDDEYPGYDVDDDRAAGRKKLGPIVHAHHEGHNVAEDAEMHDADHIDSSELGSDWDSNEEFGDDQRILAVGRKWLHEQDERARQNM